MPLQCTLILLRFYIAIREKGEVERTGEREGEGSKRNRERGSTLQVPTGKMKVLVSPLMVKLTCSLKSIINVFFKRDRGTY